MLSRGGIPVLTVVGLLLTGCGGGDDPSADTAVEAETEADTEDQPETSSDDVIGSGPVLLTVEGTDYALQAESCSSGGPYSGPDGRTLMAVGEGGFPAFELAYNPEAETSSATLTDADGATNYRADSEGLTISPVPQGAVGVATMQNTSSSGEITVAFEYTCPDSEEPTDAPDSTPVEATAKTGFVEWQGTRTDYDSDDGDLNPLEGGGLCETEDVTGTQGDDYYRISVNLSDGTAFHATSSGEFVLGETLQPIETTNVAVTKDGRTVSGSAETPDGPLEFSFTC